jgi:hypothetical protein
MLASAQVIAPKSGQLAFCNQNNPVKLSFTVPSPHTTNRPTLSKHLSGFRDSDSQGGYVVCFRLPAWAGPTVANPTASKNKNVFFTIISLLS